MASFVDWRVARVAGHRIGYCVLGAGPDLVLVKPHRGDRLYPFAAVLARHYRVIQIEPLGFGWSDRPTVHPAIGLHEQVHAVADQEKVDRFVVWGYSAGGAMALVVSHSSGRVRATICGGWSPAQRHSEAQLARMDRERRGSAGQRAFWEWHSRFDWIAELATTNVPTMVYVGTRDGPRLRGPRGISRCRQTLVELGVEVVDFDSDHGTCMSEPAFSSLVEPTARGWLYRVGA